MNAVAPRAYKTIVPLLLIGLIVLLVVVSAICNGAGPEVARSKPTPSSILRCSEHGTERYFVSS